MKYSVEPDQLTSEEASWSASTLFQKRIFHMVERSRRGVVDKLLAL